MKNAILTAKKYIKAVKESGIPVKKAYLYGSYAKKTAKIGSDLDVCVVSSVFGKDYFDETVKLRMLTLKVDSKIEPVAFNLKDINNKYDSLAVEITKTGISI